MKLKMKNLMPAIVLGVICLIVAALLATINHFTDPVIKENERLARVASLKEAFGEENSTADFGDPMTDLPNFGDDSGVLEVYEEKSGMGYAVVLSVQGRDDKIGVTVGVSSDGKILGIKITKYNDSYGKADMPEAVKILIGQSSTDNVDVLVSGATISSTAVKKAVDDALAAVKAIEEKKAASAATVSLMSYEETDTAKASRVVAALSEDRVISIAKEMMGESSDFEFVETLAPDPEAEGQFKGYIPYKAHIYKETSGKGYAVYAESFNEWSFKYGPDSIAVALIDESFTITDFKLLGWSLSPNYENEYIKDPEHPYVKRFEESFIGTTRTNFITKVDLVTEATETSSRIRSALRDAFEYIDNEHDKTVKIYKSVAAAVLFVGIAALGVAIYFQRRRRK